MPFLPCPLCQHDVVLMDIFRKDHNIRPSILLSINRVRYYLEVYSLADIVTGDGTNIHKTTF